MYKASFSKEKLKDLRKGISIDYTAKVESPLHQGADTKLGIISPFNRRKISARQETIIHSKFMESERKLKRLAISWILYHIWDSAPTSTRSRMTIYDEIASWLKYAAFARNKESFLTILCDKFGVPQISKKDNEYFDAIDLLELFDDRELFEVIRNEVQYIILQFRKFKDDVITYSKENYRGRKEVKTKLGSLGLAMFDKETSNPLAELQSKLEVIASREPQAQRYEVSFYEMPTISGNSVRGILRRLAMYDFASRLGLNLNKYIETEENSNFFTFTPQQYHQLFTGGTISESTGLENIEKRNEFIFHCPMIGLFGSAIGTQTIQSCLQVDEPTLVCRENGNGDLSYYDFLDIIFATRLDSSKLENKVQIEGNDKETHQMMYHYEVLIKGTQLEHSFGCNSQDTLMQSAFYHLLMLFCANPRLGAMSRKLHGQLDLSELESQIPQGANELYVNHIEVNKDKIKDYFKA